ncbi:amino acid transporter [Aspergillus japonicus CBS 114.51]|uniref:Amino acid transporter n=3 Tax=Aspergillus TaxID=5052 RepID=A0A2V5HET4_ASPV1|nr:amino acid transporter [Aspergillus japonicus CBS 114.51]PYI22858.1 amino acid transporter [Aspergillus violaceofuscus CBS 115571]PYI29780.1 amino acid transporter [Aspergillus indologenus CBS 114.80]RAH80590.1 amino acid transporter [Aspergillus japonicus CBS 114.51]
MSNLDLEKKPSTGQVMPSSESASGSEDADALKLAEMGYTQDLQRNFSVLSLVGIAFCMSNSWFGISASLITGISSGGTVIIIYGLLWITFISCCVGSSLSELASAMPNAGGQYFWADQLAPKKYARFASYVTGWFGYAGAIFASASVALSLGSGVVGMWELGHPSFVPKPWHTVVAYELINLFCYLFNCWGKFLPAVAKATLYISLLSFFVILVTVPACAKPHASASFVFGHFVNSTGWKSDGIAFIVGLINPNWIFACLDSATHLAEEVPQPERNIPIAIMATVGIGFVTSWFYCVAMFFSIQDLDALLNSSTGVPILELYYQALSNKAGAIVLETLLIVTGMGCLIACHTWQSRLAWAFARDRGVPCHQWLSTVNMKLDVPMWSHFASSLIVALLGLLYLGSSTAFNSMVTACIALLYISYSVPVICMLYRGRDNIKHGPFWLGKWGLAANYITLAWTLFCLIMYSFPATMPVNTGNMNYVSAVYGVIIFIILVDWFARGRKSFRGSQSCVEDATTTTTGHAH